MGGGELLSCTLSRVTFFLPHSILVLIFLLNCIQKTVHVVIMHLECSQRDLACITISSRSRTRPTLRYSFCALFQSVPLPLLLTFTSRVVLFGFVLYVHQIIQCVLCVWFHSPWCGQLSIVHSHRHLEYHGVNKPLY